ncbi:hypothetical protein K8M07_05145 [Schnuerera sp. xch1]|uniref:hypothetical protein n=1 Tax=Schnuerera sp. xch1 TaxID=2874283 RepID=UPI001CBB19EB|nr:hypothetical protein [Schnuerera sp. xch1]MBZ2174630.1 hypothetical protein [Schnuerera sp. xch1]
MNTFLSMLIKSKYSPSFYKEDSHNDALEVFNALTLKEKCQYLIKISKRNTSHQSLVLLGLTLLAFTVDYLY